VQESELFPVVYEDDDVLVINKPAGLVCHPTKGDVYSSLISRVRLYLGASTTPQLVNRLDRETSGVVLIAKHPEAALQLRRIWEERLVQKLYCAIVHGSVRPEHELIEAPLGKDLSSPVAIKDTVRPDGAPAQTEYWVRQHFQHRSQPFTRLDVRPRTGRKHQIRIHLAWRGHPLVGDKLYGLDEQLYLAFVQGRLTQADRARLLLPCHALHAREVRFVWRDEERVFAAAPETWFEQFCTEF
jgi:23S rRNA pseudouridine1911/1915/1917 synthase